MNLTQKQQKQLALAGIGFTAALLLYQFWTKSNLKSELKTGLSKCRRAAHDLLKLEGKSDTDAVNQAGEYCGEDGDLYTESP